MPAALRSFLATVAVVWALLGIAGAAYARQLSIPAPLAAAVIAAFLIEAVFYLAPGFETLREQGSKRLPSARLAALLLASALVPYCVYSVPGGAFRWTSFAAIALLAGLAGFWYVRLPRSRATDLAFLALVAGVVLAKVFRLVYLSPAPRLHLEILGQLMWIRLGVSAVLLLRGAEGIGFGFLPDAREWKIGVLHSLYFAPLGAALAWVTGFAGFQPVPEPWWRFALLAAATFLGMLWVVALGEEFFFRGLLQQWLSGWLGSRTAGLLIASAVFGLAHLPFRSFPNWRLAAIAAVAGWFYGRAYVCAGSIRAAMVTHALVNTAWRMLFT